MFNFLNKRYKKESGQGLIEYLLLLLIAVMGLTVYLQLDDTISWKLKEIASEIIIDTNKDLPETELEDKTPENLSPPVADFTVPTPNYKGRDVRFVDKSYDPDGVVEHYVWTVNGNEYRQTRKEIVDNTGFICGDNSPSGCPPFRYSGTYTVSLYVIDNDGLVSNTISKVIQIENRGPTIEGYARNHDGQTPSPASGTNIRSYQYCPVTFYNSYDDPDLPYENLKLTSVFTDHTGKKTNYNTVPNQFERLMLNIGNNTYSATVTDEDGSYDSHTVTVNVIANPNIPIGTKDPLSIPLNNRCGNAPILGNPQYKINVLTPYSSKTGNSYVFDIPAGQAYITIDIEAIPTWISGISMNSEPYWWKSSNTTKFATDWYRDTHKKMQITLSGLETVTITGMARDARATTDSTSTSSEGNSNQDFVILSTNPNNPDLPNAVISSPEISEINVESLIPPNTKTYTANISYIENGNYPIGIKEYNSNDIYFTTPIESINSYGSNGTPIKGVKWYYMDKSTESSGNPVDLARIIKLKGDSANLTDTFETQYKNPDGTFTKHNSTWFKSKIDLPTVLNNFINTGDLNVSKQPEFHLGNGYSSISLSNGMANNVFTMKLKVVDMNGVESDYATLNIVLTESNNPPIGVCYINTGSGNYVSDGSSNGTYKMSEPNLSYKGPVFVAAPFGKVMDLDGDPLQIKWRKDDGTTTNYIPLTGSKADVPDTTEWLFNSPGKHKIFATLSDGKVESAEIPCYLEIASPTVGKIYMEYWDIHNRAKLVAEPVSLYNASYMQENGKKVGYLTLNEILDETFFTFTRQNDSYSFSTSSQNLYYVPAPIKGTCTGTDNSCYHYEIKYKIPNAAHSSSAGSYLTTMYLATDTGDSNKSDFANSVYPNKSAPSAFPVNHDIKYATKSSYFFRLGTVPTNIGCSATTFGAKYYSYDEVIAVNKYNQAMKEYGGDVRLQFLENFVPCSGKPIFQ